MACNPTRIELSNSAATTLTVTLTSDPGDGVTVLLIVDALGISVSGTTSGGSATLTPVAAVVADTNSLWDAVIQVGLNRPAVAEILITETNTAQNLGITITDSEVTYCAPMSGGGGGTGDALTSGDLDQFADVTYAASIRPADVLSRTTTSSWNNQRPEHLKVDRRPICGSWYSAEANDAFWGCTGTRYTKTPATGGDMSNPSTNGKLQFIIDRFLVNTIGASGKMQHGFERYSIGNPAGMTLDTSLGYWHYPAAAGSGLTLTQSILRSEDGSSAVKTLQTPFTSNGTTSGTVGDNVEAWQYAIQYLRDQFPYVDNLGNSKTRPIEVSAYIGYKPQYADADQTTYERTALAVNPNHARSQFPGFWDDGFWSVEWAALKNCGFDTLGFDTGGRMWFDGDVEGRAIVDGAYDTINDKIFVEAIARRTGGLQEVDSRCYENVRSLTIFPQLASIVYNGEEYTKIDGSGAEFNTGSVRVSQWKLDPSNTECHVLFNWFDIKEDSRFTQEIVEGCAREAHRRGFVVGVYNPLGTATIPATGGGTYSAADFCKFVEDLYFESLGETTATAGAVDSVNGETGAVVLTGQDIDTTPTSGVPITSELGNKADAATLTDLGGGNVTGTISTTLNAYTLTASLDLNDLGDVAAPTPADGEVLQYDNASGTWVSAGVGGTGTVTSVGLNVPGGFTVAGTNPITGAGTFEITSTLDGIIKGDGAATFSGGAVLNDLADVNIATGAGNDGDLIYFNNAGGAGDKFKGVARSSIGLSEFDNDLTESDLPSIQDSYLMLIESPSDKTYIIDGRVAAARTITNFYAKTSSGTCTATLKNVTDTTTIGTISVTSTGGSAASLSNTLIAENRRLAIEISSNSSSEDLELVVEYTQ